ncbi:MAG: carbohydrate porin [Gammaproteobacteria bacterium]|nr:carbohydrate porin [Rhodocyclaceae bacterium]MBU3909439.1 carbohydrate porin [Gammaproteobacteria bacterium]MBU3988599.1 carbohydrate porin [Gammaproteobacteria bacterium]MBU4003617.1 carbohydrate porin [Gammaproteobacteria bacterium]MBU4021975.1 carbohydrate porin [Gammaproteobacteria bacterium]
MRFMRSITCAVVLAATAAAHAADEESTPDYARNTAIGDPGGQRTALFKQGLSVEAGYKLDYLRNLAGGIGHGSASIGNLDLKLRADLDHLLGLPGASAYLHVLDNRGTGINARHLGSLMGVSNIEVTVPTTRIFHAWVQQTYMEEQWSLLAGLYPIDSEFSVMESASVLLHPAYGPPADLVLTRGPSIFNNSAFGLRLKWQAPDRTLYAMSAILDGIPGDPQQPKGTHIRFDKGDGSFAIAEVGWTPIEYGHVFEPTGPTRMLQTPELRAHEKYEGHGKYAAGLWRYSNKVADQLQTDGAGNPLKKPSWGGYLLGERSLFGIGTEPGRYLTGFARYAFTDGDSTPLSAQLNLGVSVRGLFAARTDDILALAWTEARLAAKFRAAQWRDHGNITARNETALELTYRAALTPWLSIQPNLQWIRHPGGDADAQNARIAGVRLEILL